MKKYLIEIKWGFIFSVIMLAWMYFEKLMGWHDVHIDKHVYFTNLFAIPAVILYFFALLDKRKNYYEGKMSWLQGFVSGVLIGLVVAVLSPLIQFISLEYISPEYLDNAARYAVEANKLETTEAKEYYTLGNYILQGVIGALAMGAITAGVIAIFIRKK